MKQKILMLLAAVLLSCASTFAQSGNNGALKGDMNGDGRVDVADITAIVDIVMKGEAGYFYLGTTQPKAENYQTIPGVVASYMSIGEALGTTASVAAGETLYMLCPAGWMKGENVIIEDEDGNSVSFSDDVDNVTISGYAIYKTQTWNDAATIMLKASTYDYYFGQATEDQIQNQSYINSLINNMSGKPTQLDIKEGFNILIVPKTWGLPTIKDPAGFLFSSYECDELGIVNPTNKLVFVYECSASGITLCTITGWTPVEDQTTTYDYYFGQATEDQIQNQSYINSLTENKSGKPTELNFVRGYNVVIVPKEWGLPTITDPAGFQFSEYDASELGITNPTGKLVYVYECSGKIITATITGWTPVEDQTTVQQNNYFLGATSKESFTLSDLNEYVATKPSSITVPCTIEQEKWTVWIYPAAWGRPISAISSLSHSEEVQSFNYGEVGVPEGFEAMWVDSTSECTYTLTWGD